MRLAPPLLCCSALLLLPLVPSDPGRTTLVDGARTPALATTGARVTQTAQNRVPAEPSWSARYTITPERKALLNTIRFAEGTWRGGSPDGYRMIYGGELVSSLKRHPERVVVKRYASAAAGAYQFMPDTWESASGSLNLRGFGPANQDQAALYLVERSGALAAIDRGRLTPDLMARLAPIWASFPNLAGESHYGQPVKRGDELSRFYAVSLQRLRATS
jgi:muramidase (phage lysozyme)